MIYEGVCVRDFLLLAMVFILWNFWNFFVECYCGLQGWQGYYYSGRSQSEVGVALPGRWMVCECIEISYLAGRYDCYDVGAVGSRV